MRLARMLASRAYAPSFTEKPGVPFLAILLALHMICFLSLFPSQARAVKACPEPVVAHQPDGSAVTIYLRGDEYLHWNEDEAGFAVVKSADEQWWVYAALELGRLVPTSHVVGAVDPVSLGLSKPDIAAMKAAIQDKPMLKANSGTIEPMANPTGTMRNLVLLVNFSDLAITRSTAAYDSLFNTVGYTFDGASGSVKDFYTEASYGLLTVQSTVPAAVTLANGYAYYGANDAFGNDLRPREMVQQALAALEARGFDFTTMDGDGDGWIDGLTVIHAGGGEEYSGNDANYIWSHKWQLASAVTYDGVKMQVYHTEPARRGWDAYPTTLGITRIGVICHENGHFLGLPDLYDYGYDSEGAGNFCLMGGGSWNGTYGTKPAHPSAYCKSLLTWLTPTTIAGSGYYPLSQAETVPQVYKMQGPWPSTQYILVENRQGVGFDSGLPGTQRGILIWHVDRTVSNNNDQTHYMVDLEEASGTQHLAANTNGGEDSDYFRSGTMTAFNSTTTPNNLSYSGVALGLNIAEVSATGGTMSFLVNPLTVAITAPAVGATVAVGATTPITWTMSGTPDSTSIYLSIDSGASYLYTVATGLVGVTTYSWTVPNYPVTTARLRVVAYLNGHVIGSDIMDGNFTILGGPYHYASPAGGNVYPYTTPAWAAHAIQDAIDAAVSGDSILVAASTYSETLLVDAAVYLQGGWDAGFAVWNPGTNVTTIQSAASVVTFASVASGTPGIEGFTIAGGSGTEAYLPEQGFYGGGIYVYDSPAIIRDNVITGCGYASATEFSGGGGISVWSGSVTMEGNTIVDCVAQCGGGIYLYQATASITGNTISGAEPNAEYTGSKQGGGIYARQSNVTMSGNVISGNTGYQEGGGVYARLSPLTMSGDSIRSNATTTNGGGICGDHSSVSMHYAYVTDNVAAAMGGGIYHRAELLEMTNCLVAGNGASMIGGGVYADSCWGAWTNNTIDRNASAYLAGNVQIGAVAAALDIRNNAITYGSPEGFRADAETNITYQYNNCFGNLSGNVVTLVPDATNASRNPAYADTAAMDYHLGVHSGSIDAGDPSGTDPDGSRADQGLFGGSGAIFAAPDYVRNLAATATNDTTIEISWDGVASPGLDCYAVYSDTAAGFLPDIANFVATVDAAATSFQHHPVGGCLYYRVDAVNGSGYAGGYSNQAGACAAGPDLIPPTVMVVSPNGGESFAPGDTIDIQWTAEDNRQVDSVSVYCSVNGGIDFVLVASGEANDLQFQWIAPEIASDSCLVRIVAFDPGLLAGEDVSDDFFTIRAATGADDLPIAFALAQNYPNPFNPATTIEYSVAKACPVEIAVFDASGRRVATLVSGIEAQGVHKAVWNGKNDRGASVASGVYFYRLTAGEFREIKKMILLR